MRLTKNVFSISIVFALMVSLISCTKKYENIDFNDNTNMGTFTDPRDGQEYKTVTIGNQTWLAENFNFNPQKCGGCEVYARFYNWRKIYEVMPDGWHFPTEEECLELIDFLGGDSIAGGKMKETGNVHWLNPNKGANNSSGFTALPAGIYDYNSGCALREERAFFWIPDSNKVYESRSMVLFYNSDEVKIENNISEDNAVSIRLIKDQ